MEFAGYPFGSLVPYCLDVTGKPLLLLSHLAQHTRILAENPKASFTVVGPIAGDVQQAERLVAVGALIQRIIFSCPVTDPGTLRDQLAQMVAGG